MVFQNLLNFLARPIGYLAKYQSAKNLLNFLYLNQVRYVQLINETTQERKL